MTQGEWLRCSPFLVKMERLTDHLQQVAMHSDLAQFYQWLCTYMLYTHTVITPTVEIIRTSAHSPPAREPVLKQLRWKGTHLLLPQHVLEVIPPRPLALLAVRNYIEAVTSRRYTVQSILLTVAIILVVSPIAYIVGERFSKEAHRWLFHLVVLVPIHKVWSWRDHLAEQIERELLKHAGDADAILQALETAVKLDIQAGVPDKLVNDLLARLNTLRREHGYAEVNKNDLLPPPPTEDEEQKPSPAPAIDKVEFLHRHPPDEYNQVDRVEA
ncbi:MAG: hypothetical protein KatS3mg022_3218 [Armatimonadota bacterium]|nr:MAG: hypothetical protein KatS3mg022_3218 [Armatimonadota bacterium]